MDITSLRQQGIQAEEEVSSCRRDVEQVRAELLSGGDELNRGGEAAVKSSAEGRAEQRRTMRRMPSCSKHKQRTSWHAGCARTAAS